MGCQGAARTGCSKGQVSRGPRVMPAQAVPSLTRHGPPAPERGGQGRVLETGSTCSPIQSPIRSSRRQGCRQDWRHGCSTGPRGPRVTRGTGDRHPYSIARAGTGGSGLSWNGAPRPMGRGYGWESQVRLVSTVKVYWCSQGSDINILLNPIEIQFHTFISAPVFAYCICPISEFLLLSFTCQFLFQMVTVKVLPVTRFLIIKNFHKACSFWRFPSAGMPQ